ncbi:Hypothetical predicted protein [Paramuricea clavata]|uniref:Uncharacterized protein n=1 Tax=Paramuricea clavata TaxID=317549 RepID=A0A6S7FKX8_PARCT|nr:Hypothetical predicted protein [Paramuricea clavata]
MTIVILYNECRIYTMTCEAKKAVSLAIFLQCLEPIAKYLVVEQAERMLGSESFEFRLAKTNDQLELERLGLRNIITKNRHMDKSLRRQIDIKGELHVFEHRNIPRLKYIDCRTGILIFFVSNELKLCERGNNVRTTYIYQAKPGSNKIAQTF